MKRVGVLLAVVGLFVAGCDGGSGRDVPLRSPRSTPTSSDALVIGLVGTMSGRDRWRGTDAYEGAEVAVRFLNATAPRGRRLFELVTLDDRGDPDRAVDLIESLGVSPQTVGVLYAGPPAALVAAERPLAAARLPAFLLYGDLYAARKLSPHVFQASPSLLWEARRLASYILRDRGYSKVGLLHERSLTGATARRALRSGLREYGAARLVPFRYDPRDLEPVPILLRKLRGLKVQALVVHGAPGFFEAVAETLEDMGAGYRGTAAARRAARRGKRAWAPQLMGFDLAISPDVVVQRAGTVAAETYARGAHYLPIPSLRSFRAAFVDWWDTEPLGWERRAYEAARLIGWAHAHARAGEDLAVTLERVRERRFGGLDVTLGPDDHTTVTETQVGLWVVPSEDAKVKERARLPESLPWVPLARGFSINGRRTIMSPKDWRYLFRNPPPPVAPGPHFTKARFGVTTKRPDPTH